MLEYKDYIAVLKSNVRKPKARVQWLRATDETPFAEITGDILNNGGNLTINNKNGVRRAVDITLINVSGDYIPSPDFIWFGQKFKLWLGLEINGEDFMLPQGVFVLDNPTVSSNYSNKTVSIKGTDKFALLDGTLGGEIEGIYQVTLGSNIYNVIRTILTSDLVKDNKQPILDEKYKTQTTPYTLEKEDGTAIGEIILALADMVSANVYYDVEGRLVFEQDLDDKVKSSQWDFSEDEFNYLGATQDFKFNEVFNVVKVIGDNINGQIFDYTATNNNLQNPLSVPNLGRKRVKIISDSNIYSDQLAIDRANYELKRLMAMQSEVSLNSVPMYHLDVDKVITLTDRSLKLKKERFVIDSISIPLGGGGNMSIKTVKSSDLLIS